MGVEKTFRVDKKGISIVCRNIIHKLEDLCSGISVKVLNFQAVTQSSGMSPNLPASNGAC